MNTKQGIGIFVAILSIGILVLIALPSSDDTSQSSVASNSSNSQQASNAETSDSEMNMQNTSNSSDESMNSNLDPNNYTSGANIGETVDATGRSEVSVSINDFIYETTYLKISPGTTVTWANDGRVRHDVTSANNSPQGGLASELLSNGESYSYTFSEAGLYEYFCSPHPTQMRATILVEET